LTTTVISQLWSMVSSGALERGPNTETMPVKQVTANKANSETLIMLLMGAYLRAPEQSNLFITAIPIKQWTKDVFNPYRVALRKQLLGEYEVSVNNGKSRTIAIDNLDITFEGAGIWFYYVLGDSGNDNPKYSWLPL